MKSMQCLGCVLNHSMRIQKNVNLRERCVCELFGNNLRYAIAPVGYCFLDLQASNSEL